MTANQYCQGLSFLELARIHRWLEELLIRHQEALIHLDGPRARRLFDAYRALLDRHIHHEDEVLLPVFRRIGEIKRWPAELFSGEHRKLEAFLVRIAEALEALGQPKSENARAIIALLDLEGGLKRLQEHHDEREQQCLFPVLDQVTSPEERRALLTRLFDEFRQAMVAALASEAADYT